MTAHPVPSEFETRTNATYDALMWALSRPGLIRALPGQGPAQIVEALIDRECAVHCADTDLAALVARTGAAPVAPEAADHLFVSALSPDLPGRLALGSDLHPEHGATLVAPATLGQGARLRLSGPGVDGTLEVAVGEVPDGFWTGRDRVLRYPLGFELFLVDGDRVLGLPRSTRVEVL
ncbi:phosphonate C-P lyase system protein PhnH [Salipiger mucosus]|uniref:PhnH protein n=1 Tax=Salipiger mucosus DSM 16094 TaxID=1123237 RepID=S9QV37_9RHOB|nr:phosphonate C-P lyase system protein PhnH [Salipiger mucosus]EPX85256.1 PhnH protein [Salipiger mucosus DSM 16094]